MDTHPGAPRPARATRLLAQLVVLTAATTLAVCGAGTATATSSSSVTTLTATRPALAPDTYEKRLRKLVNRRRDARGLHGLRPAGCPDRVAEEWSRFLALSGEFYHQSVQDLLSLCEARYAAETLGRGPISPRRLVQMWMQSEGHRNVVLSPKARQIGIGATPDGAGGWVVAAEFMRL